MTKQNTNHRPAKQPSKFAGIRPNEFPTRDYRVEAVVAALIDGEFLLPRASNPSVAEDVEAAGKTHVMLGIHSKVYDSVRIPARCVSALAALGVNYRKLLHIILSADSDSVDNMGVIYGPYQDIIAGVDADGFIRYQELECRAVIADIALVYVAVGVYLDLEAHDAKKA